MSAAKFPLDYQVLLSIKEEGENPGGSSWLVLELQDPLHIKCCGFTYELHSSTAVLLHCQYYFNLAKQSRFIHTEAVKLLPQWCRSLKPGV